MPRLTRLLLSLMVVFLLPEAVGLDGGKARAQRPAMSPLEEDQVRGLAEFADKATTVGVFRFDAPCFECRVRDLAAGKLLAEIPSATLLDEREAVVVKGIVASRRSYLFGLAKPCGPFIADFGVVFGRLEGRAVFLISSVCAWGRLVLEEPHQYYLFNIREEALQDLRRELESALERRKER